MVRQPYTLTGPIGARASLGLVVLQVDETIEQDFRRMFRSDDVALYVTRIPSGAELTPATIATMEAALPAAVGLLPSSVAFDAVAYACTSGTTLIGAGRVHALIRGAARTQHVTDPLTATVAALRRLGARSIGIVSPYVAEVSEPLRRAFEANGLAVRAIASFEEEVEARVARIDPASTLDAGLAIGGRHDIDAVFLSCTNLRTLDIVAELEEALAKPVVSSNQALAWHMAQLSGTGDLVSGPGLIMATRSGAPPARGPA